MTFIKQLWKAWQWGIGKTILATIAAHGNSVSVGLCQGYSAVLLPQLTQSDSAILVSSDEASWIASLGVISNPVGAVLAGILMEMVGRKTTIQIATLPYLIGWITIAFSETFYMLCAGRFISGLAVGMASASYVYVAEISPCEHRGVLSALGPVLVSLGVLLVYVLGAVSAWQNVAAMCTVLAVISFLGSCAIPESPAWLATKHRPADAERALMWLRSNPNLVDKELKELLQTTQHHTTTASNPHDARAPVATPVPSSCLDSMKTFFGPNLWRPFIILVLFFAFQEGSGIYIILYYAVNLFKEVGTELNEYVASIVVAVMRLFMSVVGAVLIKNVERKTLAVISGLGMAASMAVGGTYEHYNAGIEPSERSLGWVPLACVLTHVCVSMVGFLQIPWVMTGELFPLRVRGIMGGVVSSIAHILIFASVKTYPNLHSALGLDGTLWFFATASAAGAIYCAIFLPETKGKSLLEIEMSFSKKNDDIKVSSGNEKRLANNLSVFVVDLSGLDSLKPRLENEKPE